MRNAASRGAPVQMAKACRATCANIVIRVLARTYRGTQAVRVEISVTRVACCFAPGREGKKICHCARNGPNRQLLDRKMRRRV